jgi:hypothetical protein
MSFERDSQGLFVRAQRSLARPRGQGQSLATHLIAAFVLGTLSTLALIAGVIAWPFPRRLGDGGERWSRFDGTPRSLDSYVWYAIALSLVMLTLYVVGTAVLDKGPRAVLPAWVGGVQVLGWAAAVVIVVVHWIRGDDFANYLPASSDTGAYIFAVFVLSAVLGALIVLRVLRRRIIRANRRRTEFIKNRREGLI